jgi:rubrerythrin
MTFNREDLSMKKNGYNEKQLEELLYQALETEIGGIEIYRQAVLTGRARRLRTWT